MRILVLMFCVDSVCLKKDIKLKYDELSMTKSWNE